jgi:hypothetical protein
LEVKNTEEISATVKKTQNFFFFFLDR